MYFCKEIVLWDNHSVGLFYIIDVFKSILWIVLIFCEQIDTQKIKNLELSFVGCGGACLVGCTYFFLDLQNEP